MKSLNVGYRYLSEDDVQLLLAKLIPNLWRGQEREWVLMKFGAFCARCSPEELETHLNIAKEKNNRVTFDSQRMAEV